MTYQFIADQQGTAPVKWMCHALQGKTPVFPEEDLEQRKRDYLAFLLRASVP